jgi:GDP-4-dehydro-6-deoxy-D-mannose reductase
MRILVTGCAGFVGPHLVAELSRELGKGTVIAPTSRAAANIPGLGEVAPLDVSDEAAVAQAVRDFGPSHLIHLSAISSPPQASTERMTAWVVNTFGTLNVAKAILRHAPDCWLLFAGSGLIYGDTARSGQPLDETALLAPGDDYSVTKAAADLALGALTRHGLKSLRLRPFNHTGPGQSERFVVPGFAAQIARIEAGLQPPVLRVGNLEASRDFLDVRDVVSAYTLAVLKSQEITPGLVLNIASGTPRTIRSILDGLLQLTQVSITVESDPARMRPSDTPFYVGNARALRERFGWAPRYCFPATLIDVLAYWRGRVSAATAGRPPIATGLSRMAR